MNRFRMFTGFIAPAIFVGVYILCASAVGQMESRNISTVPILNGERDAANQENFWGGPWNAFNTQQIETVTDIVHSGNAAYRIELGSLPANALSFVQLFSSECSPCANQRQTRDLTQYVSFEFFARNDTTTDFNMTVELKDYRDSNDHKASKTFSLPASEVWTRITSTLDLNAGWSVIGNPDLKRTYIVSLLIQHPTLVSGSYYLDDFSLTERGGALDTKTASMSAIVERLAKRFFCGLFAGQNLSTGLIYNHKNEVQLAALNTTAGVLWMLPKAIERDWVNQTDADSFVSKLVNTLNNNLDLTTYLPTRFIDPQNVGLPGGNQEESSVDAAFMALALENYKVQPRLDAKLANQINQVQNRFRFDAFVSTDGFLLAFSPITGFTGQTYDGYTGESKIVSMAAEVSDQHHVPIAQLWHSDVLRSRNHLADAGNAHITHSNSDFRAPFTQSLLNLFVDTKNRGVDSFPVVSQALNPWRNFVRYQRDVAISLQQVGRENWFQPDAASGAPFSPYAQYSLYADFGQPELFMPWSVGFALLSKTDGAENALRHLLEIDGIMGPLGLADSARLTTGNNQPYFVSNSGDNWNTVLSTMAMMEWLDRTEGMQSASEKFAGSPKISSALDELFFDNGDVNRDGDVNLLDVAPFINLLLGNEYQAEGDVNCDGSVDLLDVGRFVQLLGGS